MSSAAPAGMLASQQATSALRTEKRLFSAASSNGLMSVSYWVSRWALTDSSWDDMRNRAL